MSVRTIHAREEVCDVVCEIGEGPIWDERFDLLRWVDITAGRVHSLNPGVGQVDTWDLGQETGFIVPTGPDKLLAGVRDGFALVSLDGSLTIERGVEREEPHMRMNDGKADPVGRVWAGTTAIDDPERPGTLYRLDRDWSIEAQLTDLSIPNGIGWSPSGTTMYFTDSAWKRIDSFNYDCATGAIDHQRTLAEVPGEGVLPDGLTVDEDGCVWVALWGGAAVHRFTPDGRLDTIARIPALQATSCVFGGPDRRDLFVTSAAYDLNQQEWAEYPRCGRIFVCRPGVAGRPTDSFCPLGPK